VENGVKRMRISYKRQNYHLEMEQG
jgi:hypothetical protein